MTIEIPDDLAHELEKLAALQQKSPRDLALERLRVPAQVASSPQHLLQSLRELPHPSAAAIDELDAAIAAGRTPLSQIGPFD